MKKLLIVLLILLAGLTAAQPLSQPENQHYEIKIVSDYPSQGSMEALVNVQENEKRKMVLRNDPAADLNKRCNILYDASITKHSNPCNLIE